MKLQTLAALAAGITLTGVAFVFATGAFDTNHSAARAADVDAGLLNEARASQTEAFQPQRATIAAPSAVPVVTLHAEGAQIYECKTVDDGKLAWTFREPIATLILDGKTVGRHYAGPHWEYADRSIVEAKTAATALGATANDIAWLKLDVIGRHGAGTLVNVDIVQRINTSGGVLHGGCEQAGGLRTVPYSADYVFLRKGG